MTINNIANNNCYHLALKKYFMVCKCYVSYVEAHRGHISCLKALQRPGHRAQWEVQSMDSNPVLPLAKPVFLFPSLCHLPFATFVPTPQTQICLHQYCFSTKLPTDVPLCFSLILEHLRINPKHRRHLKRLVFIYLIYF